MVFRIVKEVKDINRLREILTVLFEEGFDFAIEKTKLKHKVPLTKRIRERLKQKEKHTIEKRLRLTLERLGPTFIKFGQVLSVRPDLIPKSYIKELENLQDKVPDFPYSVVREQVKKELGKEIEEIFSEFGKKPIASASISQVHKAELKDGSKVAVKVQRPDVMKIMETDIDIMFYAARLLEKHMPNLRKFNPVGVIEEFSKWTEKELDFKREAFNAKRFARNFSGSKTVKIPKIYDDFTTEKILVMEFIDGIELHNIKEAKRRKIDLKPIINNGFEAILTQVFVHGLFHADPHPGNIIITKDRKVAFVDFGIVGHFDENLKSKSIELFDGVINNEPEKVVDTLIALSSAEATNKEELLDDVGEVLDSLQDSDITRIKVSYALEEVMDLALSYGLKMPAPFVLFGKTIATLEGVALKYDPNFKIVDATKPFLEKLIAQRMSPLSIFRNFIHHSYRYKRFVEDLPSRADKALSAIEKGRITVDIKDTDIKKLAIEIDKSSNRIAYGLIISALLLSSAVMLQFNKGPKLFDTPIFSLLSFIFAAFLGIVLFWSIIKEEHWLMGNNSQ